MNRQICYMGLWQPLGWRVKLYGIAQDKPHPALELIEVAKVLARNCLPLPPITRSWYGVGFIGVQEGPDYNTIFVNWWQNLYELRHHLFISPKHAPTQFHEYSRQALIGDIWVLELQAHERLAWVEHVLENPSTPDFDRYLQTIYEGKSYVPLAQETLEIAAAVIASNEA